MGVYKKRLYELLENYDIDGNLFILECQVYELVNFLIHDVHRLCKLVLEARERANIIALIPKCMDQPYLVTAEDVFDCSFDEHPAMKRYLELYGR